MRKSSFRHSFSSLPAPPSEALAKLRRAARAPKGAEPLTARSVAELCGVELKTVHNWAADGRIPHFRTPGRHLRFQAHDVVRFLESCGLELPLGQARLSVLFVGSKATAKRFQTLAPKAQVETVRSPLSALIVLGRSNPERLVLQAAAFDPLQLSLESYVRAVVAERPDVRIAVLDYHRAVRNTVRLARLEAESLESYLRP